MLRNMANATLYIVLKGTQLRLQLFKVLIAIIAMIHRGLSDGVIHFFNGCLEQSIKIVNYYHFATGNTSTPRNCE